jgi:hypothetical protein
MMCDWSPRMASPASLSPEARRLYEESVERVGEAESQIWLEYRDHYVMDEAMEAVAVPFAEWVVYFDKREEHQIRRDHLGQWCVSTVFLGLDHGFRHPDEDDQSYRPILWETMIFWEPSFTRWPRRHLKTGAWSWPRFKSAPFPHECQWRYRSTAEAIAGHERAVRLVQAVRHGPRMFKKLVRQRYGAQRSRRDRLRRRYQGLLEGAY